MLERLQEDLKEFNSSGLTACLMSAVFKLFFQRAPEVKALMSTVFKDVMVNCMDTNVKQRAIFLYRLMRTNLPAAAELAASQNSDFEQFFEDRNDECRERLFWEFNSLSVVY